MCVSIFDSIAESHFECLYHIIYSSQILTVLTHYVYFHKIDTTSVADPCALVAQKCRPDQDLGSLGARCGYLI